MQEYITLHGHPPSYRELMTELGYSSPGAVYRLIRELEKKGLIAPSDHRSWRSRIPTKINNTQDAQFPHTQLPSDNLIEVEIIGSITGGKAPELMSEPQRIVLPPRFSSPYESKDQGMLYGLIIKDSAFVSEHLLPEDIVILNPSYNEIPPGTLVFASTPTECIIGHLFQEGEIVRFKSSPYSLNTSIHQAKKRAALETQIWGIIVGSIRGIRI